MYGYQGRILRINLTTATARSEELNHEWAEKFLGGKGLGFKYLYEEVPAQADPLGPANKLIFMTGPFSGTIVPCTGKLAIITKSPLNRTALDCSIGGHAAAWLKYSGYDAIIFQGQAPSWQYVLIENDKVQFLPAEHLTGKGTKETELLLREKYGTEAAVLTIGPAGENLVPFACICSELYRQAGRGGIGAVMGSKKLKAVVIKGDRAVRAADLPALLEVTYRALRQDLLTDTNLWAHTDGTPMLVAMSNAAGILPTHNFSRGTFEHYEKINASAVKGLTKRKKACFACGLGCGNYLRSDNIEVEGPEYETLSVAGSNCGIASLEAIAAFNALCDDLGLDTISTGGVIAFAMELGTRGIHDFGLRFGDVEGYLAAPAAIAHRRGQLGELALGVKALSEKYGGQEFAMHIKGLEYPGYEPRGSWAMALAYATAPRGACHMSAWPVAEEAYGNRDPYTIEGKAELVAGMQHYNAAKFSLIFCDFWALSFDLMAELLTPLLGRKVEANALELAGERIFNLARLFNLREGYNAADDLPAARTLNEPLPDGLRRDRQLTAELFRTMLEEYYRLRGWNEKGEPLPATLEKLGL